MSLTTKHARALYKMLEKKSPAELLAIHKYVKKCVRKCGGRMPSVRAAGGSYDPDAPAWHGLVSVICLGIFICLMMGGNGLFDSTIINEFNKLPARAPQRLEKLSPTALPAEPAANAADIIKGFLPEAISLIVEDYASEFESKKIHEARMPKFREFIFITSRRFAILTNSEIKIFNEKFAEIARIRKYARSAIAMKNASLAFSTENAVYEWDCDNDPVKVFEHQSNCITQLDDGKIISVSDTDIKAGNKGNVEKFNKHGKFICAIPSGFAVLSRQFLHIYREQWLKSIDLGRIYRTISNLVWHNGCLIGSDVLSMFIYKIGDERPSNFQSNGTIICLKDGNVACVNGAELSIINPLSLDEVRHITFDSGVFLVGELDSKIVYLIGREIQRDEIVIANFPGKIKYARVLPDNRIVVCHKGQDGLVLSIWK